MEFLRTENRRFEKCNWDGSNISTHISSSIFLSFSPGSIWMKKERRNERNSEKEREGESHLTRREVSSFSLSHSFQVIIILVTQKSTHYNNNHNHYIYSPGLISLFSFPTFSFPSLSFLFILSPLSFYSLSLSLSLVIYIYFFSSSLSLVFSSRKSLFNPIIVKFCTNRKQGEKLLD